MALSFGWKAGDVRESIWCDDPALKNVSSAALAAWGEDGDASHLEPFARDGQPTRLTFRTLTPDEHRTVTGPMYDEGTATQASWRRACLMAFRIGVDFPGMPDEFQYASGVKAKKVTRLKSGHIALSDDVVRGIEQAYPLMINFYGALILNASSPTVAEKKASSPPSTQTSSSAVVSIVDGTAAQPPLKAQGAA